LERSRLQDLEDLLLERDRLEEELEDLLLERDRLEEELEDHLQAILNTAWSLMS
jgi:hypothetical protein